MAKKSVKKQNNVQAKAIKPEARSVPKPVAPELPAWVLPALLVITAVVYSKALWNGITYFDDYYYILTNPYLRDFSGKGVIAIFSHFYSSNYHPLTTLTNLLEYHFFKENALPYHLFNVLLHVANTYLAWVLAEKLSGRKVTAVVVAAMFALHPMHVESVAWISERKDVLYTCFYLLSAVCYLDYGKKDYTGNRYFYVLGFFILSLLSKSAAVTLPVMLLAIDFYKGRPLKGKAILEKIPMLALSVAFGVVAIMSQSSGNAIISLAQSFGPVNRIFLFTTSLSAYFINWVLPYNLTALHYYPTLPGSGLPWYYYLSLALVAGLGFGIFQLKKKSYFKELVFGLAFFFIAISVMLQIITVGTALYSERYTYVAYIGLFYALGQIISSLQGTKTYNNLVWAVAIFGAVFAVETWQQIGIWKDSVELFSDIIQKNPDNANTCYAYNIRGNVRRENGDLKGALEDYNTALRLYPDLESAYFNRAHVEDAQQEFKAAIDDYGQSIKRNPKYPDSYADRGWAYWETGDAKNALEDYAKALALDSNYAPAYNNRGWLYFKTNNTPAAITDFQAAIRSNPDWPKPYYNLGMAKAVSGDVPGAVEVYNKLIQSHPNEDMAYYSRGYAYFKLNDGNKACEDWKKAAELGNNEQAKQMMAKYCK